MGDDKIHKAAFITAAWFIFSFQVWQYLKKGGQFELKQHSD